MGEDATCSFLLTAVNINAAGCFYCDVRLFPPHSVLFASGGWDPTSGCVRFLVVFRTKAREDLPIDPNSGRHSTKVSIVGGALCREAEEMDSRR